MRPGDFKNLPGKKFFRKISDFLSSLRYLFCLHHGYLFKEGFTISAA
jgi:hypothetical protein